ncbi:hypothetical protein HN51_063066 [Arachis hypogaea]|nr:uncharacterized protein DS421_11g339660 [Arachis hypogaea]
MAAVFRSSLSCVLTPHFLLLFSSPFFSLSLLQHTEQLLINPRYFLFVFNSRTLLLPLLLARRSSVVVKTDLAVLYPLHSRTRSLNLSFAIVVASCLLPLHRCQKSVLQCLIFLSRSKPAADSSSLSLG